MKILVSPLNWGLGHATRCVPIIDRLLKMGHEVNIGAEGRSLAFLKQQFPGLNFYEFPGYTVNYPSTRTGWILFLFQVPGFLLSIRKEHLFLKKICEEKKFGLILSDNRYGIYHPVIPSIFITHQLKIMFPKIRLAGFKLYKIGELILQKILGHWLQKFSEIWVPDNEGSSNLSGALSHVSGIENKVKYVSLLTRFSSISPTSIASSDTGSTVNILAMVSGPEPQRTHLEKIFLTHLKDAPGRNILVLGKPEATDADIPVNQANGFQVCAHASTEKLEQWLRSAKTVICRSGYSTLMELAALKKENMILIPTPGQPEQEYLAAELQARGRAVCIDQESFSLGTAIDQPDNCKGFSDFNWDETFLENFLLSHPLINPDETILPEIK